MGDERTVSTTLDAGHGGPRLAPPRFEPGEIVARRYRIVRFIAAGGMGEVFEAHDRELDQPIALKAILPERVGPRVAEYFRREATLSRKVTHPNVCRLFDVGSDEGVSFLTMELLVGQTLAERLRQGGPLSIEEALPIVRQMAAALDAAHAAAVIHRDFKSSNVILVGERAVVTDFGLARGVDAGDVSQGSMVGTPDYMAPEQLDGGPVTSHTDVYALGIVMFEMVTGKRPFTGLTGRLTKPPPSPRQHLRNLDRRWEAAILRCLARDPAARFEHAGDVVAALEAPRPKRWRPTLLLASLALCAVIAGVALRVGAPPTMRARRTVAVLGFQNRNARADAAWLKAAFGEMVATELAAGDELRLVEGEVMARTRRELGIADADTLPREMLSRLHDDAGADYVVLGGYSTVEERVRLDVRLQDARSGETMLRLSEESSTNDLFGMVSRVGAGLRRRLGTEAVSQAETLAVRAATPATAAAARLYAEGMFALQSLDALTARTKLEAAIAAEPGFPLAHAALAQALGQLGEERIAAEEAKRALDASANLSRRDRLHVEALYHETRKDWARVAEIHRSLFTVFPDSLEDGLGLARALSAGSRAREALEVIAALRHLPPPAGTDPRIDLAEANAAASTNDYAHQQSAATAAAARGRKTGAKLLVAEALLLDAWSSRKLGQEKRGLDAIGEARDLYEAVGERRGVAMARHHLANVLQDRADLDSARREEESALAIFESLGDRLHTGYALSTIGNILCDQGDLDGARQRYERALAINREIGNRHEEAGALLNLGIVLTRLGDAAGARRAYEPARAVLHEVGDRYGEGITLLGLGEVERNAGNPRTARERFEAALATFQALGDEPDGAEAEEMLGSLLRVMGERAAARKRLDHALASAEQIKLAKVAGIALRERARLSLDEGHLDEARRDAEEAARRLAAQGAASDEAAARALLALLGQKEMLARAQELAQKSTNAGVRFEVALTAARLLPKAESQAALRALLAHAEHAPFELRLQAQLLLGGDHAAARADAAARGFSPPLMN